MGLWRKTLDFLLPNPNMCVLCEARTPALTVCGDCLAHWQHVTALEGQCRRCGQFGVRAPVCDNCRDWPAYFRGNTALLPYTGKVQDAIVRFKYHDEPWRADGFATLFRALSFAPVDMIVPVPLHRARLAERGYNQSLLLARALAEQKKLPLAEKILVRTVNTPHQVGLSRTERLRNVNGAFAVPERAQGALRGKRVLLLDDVMTTGSTLLACARTLHAAGAKEIWSLVLAATIH